MTGQTARRRGAGRVIVVLYVAAIIGAEVIAVAVGPVAGVACDAAVLLALLNSYAFAPDRSENRFLAFLALAPLLRVLSLTLPNRHVAEIWWYAMAGAPFLLGAYLAAREVPVSWPGLQFRRDGALTQAAIALAGVPLGVAAYEILTPSPLIAHLTVPSLVGAALILVVFSAFAEELVFRGLLQGAALELFGRSGLVIVGVLFAGLYIGSLSVGYVAFIGGVGLALAIAVERTGVLWGAIGARALLNIGLLLVWPTVHG